MPPDTERQSVAEESSLATEIRGAYERIFRPISTFGAMLSLADEEALVEVAA